MPFGIPTSGGGRGFAEKYMALGDLMLELKTKAIAQQKALEAITQITNYLKDVGTSPDKDLQPEQRQQFEALLRQYQTFAEIPFMSPGDYGKVIGATTEMYQLIFNNIAKNKIIKGFEEVGAIIKGFQQSLNELFPESQLGKNEALDFLANSAKSLVNLLVGYYERAAETYRKLGSSINIDTQFLSQAFNALGDLAVEASRIINSISLPRAQLEIMEQEYKKEAMKMKGEEKKKQVDELLKMYNQELKNLEEEVKQFITEYNNFKSGIETVSNLTGKETNKGERVIIKLPDLSYQALVSDNIIKTATDIIDFMRRIYQDKHSGIYQFTYNDQVLLSVKEADKMAMENISPFIKNIDTHYNKMRSLAVSIQGSLNKLREYSSLLGTQLPQPQTNVDARKSTTQKTTQTQKKANTQTTTIGNVPVKPANTAFDTVVNFNNMVLDTLNQIAKEKEEKKQIKIKIK